jgi:hypothetical protein
MNGSTLSYLALSIICLMILLLSSSQMKPKNGSFDNIANEQRQEYLLGDDPYMDEMRERYIYSEEDINLIKLLEAIEEIKHELKKNNIDQSARKYDPVVEPIEEFIDPHERGE